MEKEQEIRVKIDGKWLDANECIVESGPKGIRYIPTDSEEGRIISEAMEEASKDAD